MPQKTKLKDSVYNTFIQKVVFTKIVEGGGYKRDLDFCIEYLQKYYPDIYPYAKAYLKQKWSYNTDIYILKAVYFKAFSEFIFEILFAHEQECDCSYYGIKPIQVSYELAKCLGGIYFYYLLKKDKNKKVKFLPTVYFQSVAKEEEILPAFTENNIAVLLAPNERYLPHAAVLIQSIIENSSPENNYDIILFKTDIVERTKNLVLKQVEPYKNFSVRFVDISRNMEKYTNLPLVGHFTVEMYFRIFAPYILKNYDKILYLDSDVIVLKDIAELYKTNIDGYLLGACHDLLLYGAMLTMPLEFKVIKKTELYETPFSYFNSGVLLLNTISFRNKYRVEDILKIPQEKYFNLPDQDTLNYLAKNQTFMLDTRWNVHGNVLDFFTDKIQYAPPKFYNMILLNLKDPYIIHYTTNIKPWNTPSRHFAEVYWQYARKTVFYEQIIYNEIQAAKYEAINTTKKKHRFKHAIKKMLMPIVNLLFPKGSIRRKKLKKLLRR